ncbi:tyrosine-type recombinase/integrase [Globicatella sanguinis]|uniref:tyrosine-type recombinase/integrase n=1 Tax=Globicatella sanguinis TaxID=13076 RepID=UPI0009F89D0F|nr:tyrosine-type recombinase/integrase [Globicatella sanguinis]
MFFGHNANKPTQLVFSKYEKNTFLDPSSPRNYFYRVCKNNCLEFVNIHGFRHTHCSLLFESGVPMKDVKERLGHSDILTTMNIYAHITKEEKKDTADKFAKFMEN